jgi:hypothetical protein
MCCVYEILLIDVMIKLWYYINLCGISNYTVAVLLL